MPTSSSMFVQCWLGALPFWAGSWKCRLNESLAAQIRHRLAERLQREAEIAVRFFTIAILASSIASKYRGGLRGFDQAYPSALRNSFLRAIFIMSSGELEEFLEQLRQVGLTPGQDAAVGEMMHGEWIACPQIRFERHGQGLFSKWVATYDPMYEPRPNSGLQGDAAQAPRA